MRAPGKWCDILKGVRVQEWKWSLKQAGLHMIKIYSAKVTTDVPNRWSQIILLIIMLCHAEIQVKSYPKGVMKYSISKSNVSPLWRWLLSRSVRKHWPVIASCKTSLPLAQWRWSCDAKHILKSPKTKWWFDGQFKIPVLTYMARDSNKTKSWHDPQVTFNSSCFIVECNDKDESCAHYTVQSTSQITLLIVNH